MPLVTAFNLRTEDRLDHIEAAVREALVSLPEQQINVHEVDFVQVLKPDGFHGRSPKSTSISGSAASEGESSGARGASRQSVSADRRGRQNSEGGDTGLRR